MPLRRFIAWTWLCMAASAAGEETALYSNPVVRGNWSDPAVIRVGSDYYSVCSSNNWQPGIPILHSKDLVHWRYIGHAFQTNKNIREGITRAGVYGLEMGYNPNTRMFMIYAPLANRELYVYYSLNPVGPYKVKHLGRLGIDPGFFVDRDGRVYLVMYKGEIYELSRDGLKVKRLVSKVDIRKYRFFEGPDIFRRGDYYYLLYSDGGTRPHQPSTVSVLRSKSLTGPWTADPHNPVLFATDDGSPLQGPAHGTLIKTPRGKWYVTFHAHQLSHYSLGRSLCLEPIRWTKDGWWRPRRRAPQLRGSYIHTGHKFSLRESDDFTARKLGLNWFFHCRPDWSGQSWSLSQREGWLRINSRKGTPFETAVLRSVILQRVLRKKFTVTTRLQCRTAQDGDVAGLCFYHDPGMNFWLATSRRDGKPRIELGKTNNGRQRILASVDRSANDVYLRIAVDGQEQATASFSRDGKTWQAIGETIYFGDSWKDLRNGRGGDPDLGWVGIRKRNAWSATTFGIFAVHKQGKAKTADFDFVRVGR